MDHRSGLLLMGCLLLGPAAAPAHGAPSKDEEVLVSLQMETPKDGGADSRAVLPGEELHGGDRMALRVKVDRPAYVYLLRSSSDGSTSVIYPEAGDQQVQPGSVLRVPPAPKWFRLEEQTGQQGVTVVASERPLAPAGVLEAQHHPTMLSDDGKKDDKKDQPKGPPCNPKIKDDCNRGGREWLRARANKRGVAVIRFSFQQR